MKTIIGIGNPGNKYALTRHNAGVMFCEHLVNSSQLTDQRILISDHFMNNSGEFVKSKVNYFNINFDDLYIAHDDLDIPLGEYKITKKAPKIHNGILDISQKLKSEDYWKVRIGIDNRDKANRQLGEQYVLQNFSKQEFQKLHEVFSMISNDLS